MSLNHKESSINDTDLKLGVPTDVLCVQHSIEYKTTMEFNGITVVKDGVIVNKEYLVNKFGAEKFNQYFGQYGYTADITNSVPATTETSTTEDNSSTTSDNTTESASTNTNESTTKTETKVETPTYTDEEIEAAWKETNRVESTCIEAGYVEYTNSITKETKTEELDLVDHDYQKTDRVEATCTEDGLITYTCSVCGDSYTDNIPATGHTGGNWVTVKEAGLFSEGLEQEVCPVDDEVLSEKTIPQTCPLPLAGLIGIIVGVVVVIGGIIFFIKKRK